MRSSHVFGCQDSEAGDERPEFFGRVGSLQTVEFRQQARDLALVEARVPIGINGGKHRIVVLAAGHNKREGHLAWIWSRALRRRQVVLHVAEPGHFIATLGPNDYGNGHGSSCRRAMPGAGTRVEMRARTAAVSSGEQALR